MNPTATQRLYQLFIRLIDRPIESLVPGNRLVLKAHEGRGSSALMDLALEPLCRDPKGYLTVSLAHYFLQHGDLCCDPDLCFHVQPPGPEEPGWAEVLYFQQALPPVFCESYDRRPGMLLGTPRTAQRKKNRDFAFTFFKDHLLANAYRVVPDATPEWRGR